MDIDEFYVKSRNEFGPQQKLWFFSLVLFNLYAPFHMIQVVFVGLKPKFNCTIANITYHNICGDHHGKTMCDTVEYEPFPDTFLKEWSESPCSTSASQLVQAANMLGIMVGALTLGAVADKFGRKKVMTFTLVGMISFGLGGSFSPIFLVYIMFRFLVGVCSAGNMIATFVLSSELVGPNYRSLCGNLFQGFFALGIVAYSGLAYLIPNNWRTLSMVAALVGGFLLGVCSYVPESPRWLYANGRVREGNDVLQKLARYDTSEIEIVFPATREGTGKVTMCRMFRTKPCLVLVQLISWFTNSVTYYALTLSAHQLGKNLYLSTSLSGLVEIPAYLLTVYLIDTRLGRRLPLCLFMVVAGASCILLEFTDKNLYIGLLGKMAIAASFSIIYIHTSELFPTVVRNSGVGLCSSFARMGGIVAAVFVGAEKGVIWPTIALGILSIVSGCLNLTLPETLHKKLPETIEDLNKNEIREKYSRLLEDKDDEEVNEYDRREID